jgi:hypothetical protein
LEQAIADGGFLECQIDKIDVAHRHESKDAWWQRSQELSIPFAEAIAGLGAQELKELQEAVYRSIDPYCEASGEVVLPGRAIVALASA